MIDQLRSMAVFARVAELGSFRRAAERLGLSASVVSHHITQLEKQLGLPLLYRSTRHVALTDEGDRFYQSCAAMLQAAETALDGVHHHVTTVTGKLWILAPGSFSSGPFVGDVAAFCKQYPLVQVRLDYDDGPRNLIQEGIDVAIRFGPQQNSSLVCRQLFMHRFGLYASRGYLKQVGPITDVETLAQRDWVCLNPVEPITLYGPHGESVLVEPRARATVNSVDTLRQMVRTGLGIAQLPMMMVQHHMGADRMVPVLPQWHMDKMGCYAIYPTRAGPHAISRRFVDFLCERLSALPDEDILIAQKKV